MMSDQLQTTIFDYLNESEEELTLSQEDFLVRVSQSLESVKDLQTLLEALYFSRSYGSHLFSDHNIYFLRTSWDYSIMTGGGTFETIIGTLDELGYDVEWQVLNSKNFGVPQNRERVFIIGHLRGKSRRQVFPIRGENTNSIAVIGNLDIKHEQSSRVYSTEGLSPTLNTMQGSCKHPKILVVGTTKPEQSTSIGQRYLVYSELGLMGALTATDYKQPKQILVNEGPRAVLTPDREEKRQNGRCMKESEEPMFTLTAQDRHGVFNGNRVRKLTPLECFRLQSFPDEWYHTLKQHGISDSQLYKMAGNAVTSNVAFEIGKRIMEGDKQHERG